MNLQDFLTRFEGVQRRGDGEYVCRCPAHDDKTASLCVREGDKGIVMICQAGCDARTVCERVGLTMRDLFREEYRTGDAKGKAYAPKAKREAKPAAKDDAFAEPMTSVAPAKAKLDFVCAYRYVNEDGELLYEACRYMQGDKKTFRQRVPDASKPGGYNWSMKGVRLVLYRLPELLRAIEQGQPVFIVEGEKDVDNLYKLGRIATTSPMGAGKWHNGQYKESLENAHVYIIADNDEVGRAHANDVAQDIVDVAADVRILDIASACHELPEKGDITDFYKLLGRAEGDALLDRLMRETAPMELDPYAMVCNLYGMIPDRKSVV